MSEDLFIKMSEALNPDEFLKMKSLIEYLDLHSSITPKKLPILLSCLLPQQEDILKFLWKAVL